MKDLIKTILLCYLITAGVIWPLSSFKGDCKHIYVAVQQKEVKYEYGPSMVNAVFTPPPTGKHGGQEIVCIKCFHLTKQVIDYGEPTNVWWRGGPTDTGEARMRLDTPTLKVNKLKVDSCCTGLHKEGDFYMACPKNWQ